MVSPPRKRANGNPQTRSRRPRRAFASPEGKQYKLNAKIATLLVRPRGWHLPEKHVLVDGQPVSGSLIDFGLTLFHNARELLGLSTAGG